MITILAAGSRGDLQPYLALGVALNKAGQPVRVATFENYRRFVEDLGLDFYPVKGDVSKAVGSDQARLARSADNPLKILLSFRQLQALVFDLQKDFFDTCRGAEAVVYHPGAAIGYFIGQQLNIPSILATPFPMTPTRAYPALIFYNSPRLGKPANWITHKIFEQIMWSAARAPIKKFWRQEFGCAPQGFGCPYGRQTTQSHPTVISCSSYVFPRPGDWPEHVHSEGYWFLDQESGWEPGHDLLEFLEKGNPPVYIGFGSMPDASQAIETTHLIIDALQRSGQRGVLATGWGGMANLDRVPEDIFILESAPHSWLFPRMAAVVHHGGAGTTAAGLRAGIPSVIVPHSNDQFAWGRRVYELGVGPEPLPRKQLNADRLAQALDFALAQPVGEAAGQLGLNIRSESGAQKAAQIILHTL